MTNIEVEFFGRLSDRMGKAVSCELSGNDMTIARLRVCLADEYANDELLRPSIRPAINDQMVPENAPIVSGDRVAFLSPLSGG